MSWHFYVHFYRVDILHFLGTLLKRDSTNWHSMLSMVRNNKNLKITKNWLRTNSAMVTVCLMQPLCVWRWPQQVMFGAPSVWKTPQQFMFDSVLVCVQYTTAFYFWWYLCVFGAHYSSLCFTWSLCGHSQGSLLIERWSCDWKVVISSPGRSGGRIFFTEFSVCADLFDVQWKTKVILPKVQVAGYTWTHIHPQPNKIGVGRLCCPGSVGIYQGKWTHTQLFRKHLATVVSAHRATVDWSWPKESGIGVHEPISIKKYIKCADGEWVISPSPKSSQARKEPPTTNLCVGHTSATDFWCSLHVFRTHYSNLFDAAFLWNIPHSCFVQPSCWTCHNSFAWCNLCV